MNKTTVLLLALLASLVGLADTYYPTLTSVVNSTPSIGNTFYNKAASWTCSDSGVTVVPPNDPAASSYDYVLKHSLRGPASGNYNPWYCHSFIIDGVMLNDQKTSGVQTNDFLNEGLIVKPGGGVSVADSRYCDVVYKGKITIEGTSGEASRCSFSAGRASASEKKASVLRIAGTLIGSSSAEMKFGTTTIGARTVIEADASQYYGRAITAGSGGIGYLTLGCEIFNGTLESWDGAAIGTERADATVRVRSMQITAAAAPFIVKTDFNAKKAGLIVVTNSFTQTSKMIVQVMGAKLWKGRIPILKLEPEATGDLDANLFELDKMAIDRYRNQIGFLMPFDVHLEATTEIDGSRVLYLVSDTELAYLITGNKDPENGTDNLNPTAFTNSTWWSNSDAWSDSTTMNPDYDYFTDGKILTTDFAKKSTFPGNSLIANNYIVQMVKHWTVTNLYMLPNAYLKLTYKNDEGWGNYNSLSGNLHAVSYVPTDVITFQVYFYQHYTIGAAITGNGNLAFYGKGGSAFPRGYVHIPNANPGFKGTWRVSIMANNNSDPARRAPTELNRERFYIGSGASLGGALDEFNYKALQLDSMSLLEALDDLTIDEQTRGIFVKDFGGFGAPEGVTMNVKVPVALAGCLRKEGAGTVGMGGTLRFMDAGGALSDTPVANSNLFVVAEGAVKPLSTTAFDGLAISVTNAQARIAYDLAPADDGVRQYGIYNVKNTTDPIGSTLDGGVIPVQIDGTPDRGVGRYEIGLVTLASRGLAEAVMPKLSLPKVRGFASALSVRDNAGGSATVVCTLTCRGLTLKFR